MKLLKWIPLFCSMLLYGQENLVMVNTHDSLGLDSLWYQNYNNSFSLNDETTLIGYNPLLSSPQTNFGAPIIGWYWQSNQSTDLRIGDRILDFGTAQKFKSQSYHQKYPHTKIVYAQTYSEGQRLNFSHKRAYQYGSFVLDYDRLVSEGFLWHEKNKYTNFKFQGEFKHPEIPYQSTLRFHTFKNESEWNGGVSDDSLFLSGAQSNWELLPINWTSLESSVKHIGLDWKHDYTFSEATKLAYEINLSQDSLFYEGLQDDSLFYPLRLDSATTYQRAFTSVNHSLKWHQRINDDKGAIIGLQHQNFKYNTEATNKLIAFASLKSDFFKNEIYFEFGKEQWSNYSLIANYTQQLNFGRFNNQVKVAYEATQPSWMQLNGAIPNWEPLITCIVQSQEPIVDQYIEWDLSLINQKLKLTTSYHNIDGYTFFNENALSVRLVESVQVFQSRLNHHLNTSKWHWTGDAVYQNSSSANLPLANLLLNQKVYWQGDLFKEATETQLGLRALYRSSHPGMSYAPLLGDFYVNPTSQTEGSMRLDVFANFKIQTVKVYLAYEHLNSLWQGEQYVLKPFPMAKPIFRMSLIWNFYD